MSGDYEINPLRYNPHSASSRIHRIILVEVKSFVSNYKNTVLLLKKIFLLVGFPEAAHRRRRFREKQQEEINFLNVLAKLKSDPEIHIVPFNMILTESWGFIT